MIVSRNNAVEVDLGDTSTITTLINNNSFATGGYGVYLNSTTGNTNINATVKDNSMTTYYQSVWVVQTGSSVVNLSGNDLFATSQPTFQIDSIAAGSTTSSISVTNNTLVSSGDACIFLNQNAGDLTASISNNTLNSLYSGEGIYSKVDTQANTHTVSINKNSIFTGDNSLRIEQNGGTAEFTLNNNTLKDLGDGNGAVYWDRLQAQILLIYPSITIRLMQLILA